MPSHACLLFFSSLHCERTVRGKKPMQENSARSQLVEFRADKKLTENIYRFGDRV